MPNGPDVGFGFGVEGDQSLLAVISKLREEMKLLKSQQDQLGSSALDLSKAWRQLGALAATLKLAQFAKDAFDSVVQIGRLSAATGISTQTLSVFRKATEDAGLAHDQADQAVKRLAKSMLQLEQGNRKTAATFALLKDESGKALTAASFKGLTDDEKFRKVIDAMGRMKGGLDASGISSQLLGRNSAELLAVLQRLSGEGFAEVQAQARALGLEVTPLMVQKFAEAKESLVNLKDAATGAAMQFETGLVPELSKTADALVKVSSNTDKTKSSFEELGEDAGIALKYIVGGLIEIWIWGKAFVLTVLEDIGGRLEAAGILALSVAGAVDRATHFDMAGAWDALKQGAKDAGKVVDDVLNNSANRFRAARESEKAMLEGLSGNVKHPPHKTGRDTPDPTDTSGSGAQFALDRANIANQKAAAQEELELLRAGAQQRQAEEKNAYERGLITLKDYFQRRRAEIDKERDLEIKALGVEKTGLQGLLGKAQNLKVAPGDAAGEIKKQVELLAIKREIDSVDTKIELARIHAATQTQAVERAEFGDEKNHQLQRLEFQQKLAEAEGNTARVNELKAQAEDLRIRGQLEQLGFEKTQIDALLAELDRARTLRTTADNAQHGFEGGVAGLDEKKAQLQEKVAAGTLQPYEAERQLKAAIQAELPLLQQKVDLLRQQAQLAASGELRDQLTREATKDQQEIDKLTAESHKLAAEWKGEVKTAIKGATDTALHGFNGALLGMQSFGQAAKQVWQGILTTALNSIETIAAKWIEQHLIMKAFQKLLHTDDDSPQEQAQRTVAANITKASSDAAVSGGETFMFALAQSEGDIPYALEQSGIAYGIGIGFAGAAGLAAGGMVARSYVGGGAISGPGSSTSDSVPIWASNGEAVLTAKATRAIGGSSTIALLNRNPELFQSAMRGAQLPPIRQQAPYSAAGLRRYGPNGEISPAATAAGPSFSHSTHIGNLNALDGASVRAALEEHGDLVGKIAVRAVKKHFRGAGVNG